MFMGVSSCIETGQHLMNGRKVCQIGAPVPRAVVQQELGSLNPSAMQCPLSSYDSTAFKPETQELIHLVSPQSSKAEEVHVLGRRNEDRFE